MLSTSVYIDAPVSLGSGSYRFNLYWQNPSMPGYLNIGDYVKDTANHEYRVIAPTTIPHTDGALVTAEFVSVDSIPVIDSDYNSHAYTPNQVDVRAVMRTSGALSNPSVYNKPNYEYTILAGWDTPAQEAKAVVGDRIADSSGKEYEITFIDSGSRFAVPCRVKEVEKVGILPTSGAATMYRSTGNYKFFQGTEMSDPSRTTIQNKDFVLLDEIISSLPTGGSGSGNLTKQMQNGHSSLIPAGKPVSKLSNGKIVPADSDAANGQKYCGITLVSIDIDGLGLVALPGNNMPGVLTGLGYTCGQDVYLSESTGYTNDPGTFTGNDDSIIKLGVSDCAEGTASSTVTDLIMFTEVVLRP